MRRITWSIYIVFLEEIRQTCHFVAHVPLMTRSYSFLNVFKIPNNLSHFFEILVFSFVSHTPIFYERTTPIWNCKNEPLKREVFRWKGVLISEVHSLHLDTECPDYRGTLIRVVELHRKQFLIMYILLTL